MKKLKPVWKILSIVLTVLLAVLLLSNVYMLIVRKATGKLQPDVLGWSWAVVVSGSMEPTINIDDLVVVHKQKSYGERDIISFESGSSVVTHRIIRENDDGTFVTQGDFNNTEDSKPVSQEKIIGKVVLVIPGVGKMIKFFQEPLGISLIVFVGLLIIEMPFLIQKFKDEKEAKNEQKEDA